MTKKDDGVTLFGNSAPTHISLAVFLLNAHLDHDHHFDSCLETAFFFFKVQLPNAAASSRVIICLDSHFF